MTMSSEIPAEFLHKQANDDTSEGDIREFGNLFDEESEEFDPTTNSDGTNNEEVTIARLKYRLRSPPDVGTLFAHRVVENFWLISSHRMLTCTSKTSARSSSVLARRFLP
jgi:hypothetical protein